MSEVKKQGMKALPITWIEPSPDIVYIPMYDFGGENELDAINNAIQVTKTLVGTVLETQVTTVSISGPAGVGKTTLAQYFAKILNCPIVIVNCSADMEAQDLICSSVLIEGEMYKQYGAIPTAIMAANEKKTAILMLNEYNALREKTQIAFNSVFDHQCEVIIQQFGGERVKLNKDSHLIVFQTFNPNYAGTSSIQQSAGDRGKASLKFDYPSVNAEANLLNKLTGIPMNYAKKFAELATETRKSKDLPQPISPRGLIQFVVSSRVMGVRKAFEYTVKNKYAVGEEHYEEVFESIARGKDLDRWDLPIWELPRKDGTKPKASASPDEKKKKKITDFGDMWSDLAKTV